jgi:thiol:disulfide interchange protein DsbG
VYVFFDAQCPHCAALWVAAKPLKSQAKFVWIPVGILNAASTSQGATLLAAATRWPPWTNTKPRFRPAAAASVRQQYRCAKSRGGKKHGPDDAAWLYLHPTIVGTHAQTGALVTQEGSVVDRGACNLAGLAGARGPAGCTRAISLFALFFIRKVPPAHKPPWGTAIYLIAKPLGDWR